MNFHSTKGTHLQQNGNHEAIPNTVNSENAQDSLKRRTPKISGNEAVDLPHYKDLEVDGLDRARVSGATSITPEEVETLSVPVRAMARATRCDLFDPVNNLADQLRQEEFEKLLEDRTEIELAIDNIADLLLKAEETLAEHKIGAPPLAPSLGFRLAAMAFIALTLAVTLHDCVFIWGDEITAWLCSFILGFVCGWFFHARSAP